jgi:hypothetical protein
MLNEFVSIDFMLTFTGMIVIVNLLTQFTKKMFDKIMDNRTKWVVAGYSVLLCIFAGIWQGKFTTAREIVETCLIWLINSVVVWFAAMKAYETITDDGSKI